MANFRKNHERNKNPFVGLSIRVGLMFLFIVVMFFLAYRMFNTTSHDSSSDDLESFDGNVERDYLPISSSDLDIVHHRFYSLGYNEKYEISEWVAYVMTKSDLQVPNVKRHRDYITDPDIPGRSAHHRDYTHSGYTRGHLAPAGDMAFSKIAMKESFYMSNMTPQLRAFNNGIWKELEESVRDWAYDNEELYVVTGPIMDNIRERIGESRVGVPHSYYKALLDNKGRDKKAIAFVIPNESSDLPLKDYAMSIDALEEIIDMDLYHDLVEDEELESDYNLRKWRLSKKRHNLRVQKWNKQ